MSNADNIDDILKEKLLDQEFPFDEQNWEKARDLIDASRRRKKRLIIIWPLIGLSLITATVWLYLSNTGGDSSLAEKHNTASGSPLNVISSGITDTKQPVADDKDADNKTAYPETNSTPSNPNSIKTEKKEHPDHESETHPETKESTTLDNSEKSREPDAVHPAVAGTSPVKLSKPKMKTSRPVSDTYTGQVRVSKQETGSESKTKGINYKKESLTGREKNAIHTDNRGTDMKGEKNTGENPDVAVIHQAEESFDAYPSYMIPVQVGFLDSPADGNMIESEQPENTEIKTIPDQALQVAKVPRHLVYADAGGTYLFGWKNAAKREGDGVNLTGGLNYQFITRSRLGVSVGIQYNAIGHLINSSYIVSDTRYGFGKEENVTVIEQKKLHYLTMPVRFVFAQNPGRYFGVGCNFGYLLNSQNIIKKYEFVNGTQTQSPAPNTILTENVTNAGIFTDPVSTSNTSGYRKGFNPYDLQLSVFYRQALYERVTVGAEVFYGLMDIKQNSFFNSPYFDRNSGVKITLGCFLFKK